ncbi:TPA: restriction endonuclease subunit S [Legionella pneumophila]|nr:restriction endonuclease subunit S [Legionella pneumophila]HAU1872260.1 restriction endonuclease subunit S [Legionella pneumophila]
MLNDNLLSLSYGRIINKNIDKNEGLLPESFETYQIVNPGDIVLRLTDLQNDKRSIRQGLVKEQGIITSAYDAIYPTKGHDSRYWAYALLAIDLAKYYYSLGGGVRQSIKFKDFPNDWIHTPSLRIQNEIADFLDRETSLIDRLIEKKWSLIESLPLRVEALIDTALSASDTKWLRFGNAAKRIFRAINREDYELYITIGLYNRGRGIFHKEETYGQDLGDSTFSWVKPNDLIFSGQFAWEGAVALATKREDGKIASHRYPIYNARNGIENGYLFSYFRTHRGKFLMNDCSRGAAGRNRPLNTNRLEKEHIPIPSPALQKQIAELVYQEDALKIKITKSIKMLNIFKAALVTEAVTGQIDINKWQKQGMIDQRLDKLEQNTNNGAKAAC